MPITIAGAAGHVGRRVAELLLEQGEEVTLLVRSPEKVADLAARGAAVAVGSLDNPEFVSAGTRGAEGLFWMTAPNFGATDLAQWHRDTALAAQAAIRANRIPHVVNLSGMGTGAGREDWGMVTLMAQVERTLDDSGAHVRHLRAGWFMDNLLWQADVIRDQGALFLPYPPDVPFPLVATRDLGQVAADGLRTRNWSGSEARTLMGPESLTFAQVAEEITRALGQPCRYVPIPLEAYLEQMGRMGATADARAQYGRMFAHMAGPGGIYSEPRTPEAATATTLATFVRETLAPAVGVAARAGQG